MADPPWNQYYISTTGNDSTGSGTKVDPWKTIQKGEDACTTGGDILWIKADGTYDDDGVQLKYSGMNVNQAIIWEGYTSTEGDGGLVTYQPNQTGRHSYAVYEGSARAYRVFRNIKIVNANNTGWYLPGSDQVWFLNCESSSNGGRGYHVDNYCVFIECAALYNTGYGFWADWAPVFFACDAGYNGTTNFHAERSMRAFYCTVGTGLGVGNIDGFRSDATLATGKNVWIHNSLKGKDTSGKIGINTGDSAAGDVIINNIIQDFAKGISTPGTTHKRARLAVGWGNIFSSCSDDLDNTNWGDEADGVIAHDNDVLGEGQIWAIGGTAVFPTPPLPFSRRVAGYSYSGYGATPGCVSSPHYPEYSRGAVNLHRIEAGA